MDGLKKGMEAKMNGMEYKLDDLKNGRDSLNKGIEAKIDGIEGNMEYLKKDMEGLKKGFEKLLQEKLPNGEKVVEETHDENKRSVKHDFIDSNIPKIDMRNFDGKDHVTWILHMEQYLDLHNV